MVLKAFTLGFYLSEAYDVGLVLKTGCGKWEGVGRKSSEPAVSFQGIAETKKRRKSEERDVRNPQKHTNRQTVDGRAINRK